MENISFVRNGKEFEPTKNELKIVLNDFAKKIGELETKLAQLEQENQALKDCWEKLKEYVADNLEITQVCQDPIEQKEYWYLIGTENCYKNLQEKMQELELAELIRKKEK